MTDTMTSQNIDLSSWDTLYISTLRPIVTYAAETWTLIERDMNYLMIFERRSLRRVLVHSRKGQMEEHHELNKSIG